MGNCIRVMATTTQQTLSAVQQQQSSHQHHSHNESKESQDDHIMEPLKTIDSSLFNALLNIDLHQLAGKDLMSVLPFLAKTLLNSSFVKRQQLLQLLYPIRKMNDVLDLMLSRGLENYESTSLPQPDLSFESCSSSDRLLIVASEYMRIQECARQLTFNPTSTSKLLKSELFDNPIYVDEISYCLCILLFKSTNNTLVNILHMSEALLHIKCGPTYILRLVANMPDRCQEVCNSLITYGERQDEGANFNEVSDQRAKTIRMLCLINPAISYTVRSMTLQMCKMPSLTLMITLDHLSPALENYEALSKTLSPESEDSDEQMETDIIDNSENSSQAISDLEDSYDSAIAFITGILLGVDEGPRLWFAQYTKSAQQKRIDQSHYTVLSKFRSQILAYMSRLFNSILEDDIVRDSSGEESTKKTEVEPNKTNLAQKNLNKKLIRATATLRLFCALRGIGSLKLNQEESEILLRLVTCKPPVDQTSVNFATTGVCTLLACSALIVNQKEERRAAEWLKWLIKESNYNDNRYSSHGKCSISELLLLIAIHFQNNQNNQIAELVCATLGMKLQIKASVSKCKSLFVQEVFNDQMVAEHAVKVPVTKDLNDNITEFLPVHCIHQLLESRSFSKNQVPINDWIYRQICESKKPIHNILPKLIEAYVNSVIIATTVQGYCYTNQPISEEDIERVFKTQLYSKATEKEDISNDLFTSNCQQNGRIEKKKIKKEKKIDKTKENLENENQLEVKIIDVEAAQVLLLYYLVLYENVRVKKGHELPATERCKLTKYSQDFMMEIPVFYLLQLVRDNQNSFGAILPDLLKLVTSQYPQLCSIQHWLNIDSYVGDSSETTDYVNIKKITSNATSSMQLVKVKTELDSQKTYKSNLMKQLGTALQQIEDDQITLAKTLFLIASLPKEEIWPYVALFIESLTKLVRLRVSESQSYRKLIQATARLWWKFNTVFPRKLWVMTVNALKRPQNVRLALDVRPVEYSWDELVTDPLIVLRCDSRVFRCVDTLNIVLHILSAFLAASRRCLQEHSGRSKDFRSLEELKTTLILAQTSAAIQILLESCIPSDDEQEALSKRECDLSLDSDERLLLERFDSSVNCICEHLHQVYIADTNLAKLVHFQTYPSELLSTTSDKIPSMHICLDFIPELLSQPDLSKQVFVIELTSHLCEKYAITKSLNVAKLCFNVAYTLLQLLPSVRRALFFIPVLPALLRICKVFPILREDADLILNQINQITLAHMASTSSRLSLGSEKPFEGLEQMNWREAKKLMSTFSLHEALYLCIQKCSIDLSKLKEISKQKNLFIEPQPAPVYNTIFAYGNHVINPGS